MVSARGKVKLTRILERSKRKSSWKKRVAGAKKKLSEVTTLCDVKACLIMYPLDDPLDHKPLETVVWPSHEGAREVIAKYMSENELVRGKRMANPESHMQEMVVKATAKLDKQMYEIKIKQMKLCMMKCFEIGRVPPNLSLDDTNLMGNLIDRYLMDIDLRLKKLEMEEEEAHQNQAATTVAGASRNKGKEPMNYDASRNKGKEPMNYDASRNKGKEPMNYD
ncbi:agamous-like MADS-box protein AGL80 [Lotus japonicus]|uniref:agamous-like MADS-box protein AGL80 n=1 Tax=Lotus japonicus TaxID=34305 RepID=UPI002589B1E2|nr:agamous-like MADS-box protein AGL80 [Lotus japonicus]